MSVDAADAPPPLPPHQPQNALALRPGALIFGRFRVGSTLGSSPFAFTYAADDEQYNERVVVKEFFPRSLVSRAGGSVRAHSSADDQEFARAMKRFLREGELLADLSHPSLLRVRRAFEESGTAYTVVDYRPVTPLREHVRAIGGRLLAATAVEMSARLLEALELIHAEGGLHRDVSPDTVGVDASGRPVLVGFPASRHMHGHGRELTPGFAAIELYGSKGLGPWTDVYSCAALLYFMITGVVPPSAVERAAGEAITPPGTLVGGIAPAFVNAILRGLAQLPEQRTHSAGEFQKQVLSSLYVAGQGGAAGVPDLAPMPERPGVGTTLTSPLSIPSSDPSGPLRLTTAGLVIPEDNGIGRKVMNWLSGRATRADREERAAHAEAEAAEVLARLSTIGLGNAPANAPPPVAPLPAAAPAPEITASIAKAADPISRAEAVPEVDVPVAKAPEPIANADDSPTQFDLTDDDFEDDNFEDDDSLLDREAPLVPVRDSQYADVVERGADRAPHDAKRFDSDTIEAGARAADNFAADALESETSRPHGDVDDAFEEALEAMPSTDARLASIASLVSADFQPTPPRTPRLDFGNGMADRSRVAVVLALIVVLAGAAGGVAYARNQSGKNHDAAGARSNVATNPTRQATLTTANGQKTAPDSAHGARVEALSSGVVQQSVRPTVSDSARRRSESNAPTTNRTRGEATNSDVVPAVPGIQSVSVPITTQLGAPQLLPPEVLIDLRDRLAAGRQFSEGGDYVSAGRTLRGALAQIDSLTNRYTVSPALRSLRKDVEGEAQRTLDACLAENEIHRKRGGQILVCQ